jgi:hypothetical protein
MSMSSGKSLLKGIAFAVGAVALGVASPRTADADIVRMPIYLGTSIPLGCSNAGGSQDVAKTPVLKNTTSAPLPVGSTLWWKSTDGDSGQIKLDKALVPGATVEGLGHPGSAYTCSGSFLAMADLTVAKAQFTTQTSAFVEVQNLNPWVDTKPNITRVEVVSCSGPVLSTVDLTAPIGKGEIKSFNVPFPAVGGQKYLHIQADATNLILEGNKKNNVWDEIGTCVH